MTATIATWTTAHGSAFSSRCSRQVGLILPYYGRSLTGISRMLDLGGAPSSSTDKNNAFRIKTNQNCKVQAVFFDFDVLTRSLDSAAPRQTSADVGNSTTKTTPSTTLGQVQANLAAVQDVANLLKVELDTNVTTNKPNQPDDLSLLLRGEGTETKSTKKSLNSSKTTIATAPHLSDVRLKYADKLAQRGMGMSAVDRAKAEVHENAKTGGDAAGHWAARKTVASLAAEPSSHTQKWVASTGTGKLLRYLTQRGMNITLLPRSQMDVPRMQDLVRQLPDVALDWLQMDNDDERTASSTSSRDIDDRVQALVQEATAKMNTDPSQILLVSDRDDYLQHAKDAGLVTCRLRPKNARQGKVSAHYNVTSVPDVHNVLNEINGISFTAVLQGR